MNYRHAYHAGNFADCFKHALLVALIEALSVKPTPFFVLDSHAGTGWYDLDAEPARRTMEADTGIRRLQQTRPPMLHRYLQLVDRLAPYPGSPVLIRALLRPHDRLACCELHPEEVACLRRRFHRDPQVAVHARSGWEALGALLPPKEKRGLVLVDPPFEDAAEFSILARGLCHGHRRFARGIFAAWYPIKQLASVRSFLAEMKASCIRDIIAVELWLRAPVDASRLNGCGLLVINPPFQFEFRARQIATAVLSGLGSNESGARTEIARIADE